MHNKNGSHYKNDCERSFLINLGRSIAESHCKSCLYAGIEFKCFGNENSFGLWSFEIGPCEGIDIADQLLLAKYILIRVAEDYNIVIKFNQNDSELILDCLNFQ